jgi:hypothetical protein
MGKAEVIALPEEEAEAQKYLDRARAFVEKSDYDSAMAVIDEGICRTYVPCEPLAELYLEKAVVLKRNGKLPEAVGAENEAARVRVKILSEVNENERDKFFTRGPAPKTYDS